MGGIFAPHEKEENHVDLNYFSCKVILLHKIFMWSNRNKYLDRKRYFVEKSNFAPRKSLND